MTLAIVHYHLDAGGVSQVIIAASRALTIAGVRHVILIGSPPALALSDLPFRIVPGLGYLDETGDPTPQELTGCLRHAAIDALGQAPAIWHFHNHSLGKNPLVPQVVATLAAENECLILQIHDLAEEGRHQLYQRVMDCRNLYPVSPRIHYAFLNSSDRETFIKSGLPAENSSVFENPIDPPATSTPSQSARAILFAPIRGIRRKNLGELVFLSALAPTGCGFAISRAPANPDALPIHDTWRAFSHRHRLPIEFDVTDRFSPVPGAAPSFESWLVHATHFVTTSVSEGFGLPFLEAIAHGKPLIGRNLTHLAADHARHGIRTGNLYERLLIPTDWIDLTLVKDHLCSTLERNFRLLRRQLTKEFTSATLAALQHDGYLDFANLPEPLQQSAIERVTDPTNWKSPRVKIGNSLESAADWLASAIANRSPSGSTTQLAPYSLATYQKKITSLCSHLVAQPSHTISYIPTSRILSAHLSPSSFHFLLSALPPIPPSKPFRAVIFDIYGTLLIAPAGGVKPDPSADTIIRKIIADFGHSPPESPTTALHDTVLSHHTAAKHPFPEVDLRILWREVLSLDPGTETSQLVQAIEDAWHPAQLMPGAEKIIQHLSRSGTSLGLLSNAQCNTLTTLGDAALLFAPELTILSYQHGIAKPSPILFEILTDRLAGRDITPAETLFVGNDPLQDIVPAANHGFKTALFTGHPDSLRPGDCSPDFIINRWSDLAALETNGVINIPIL
ncbi:MAG: HAD hydrolase-like protein [Gloeobacteraceae cyanobacterium ES-bin-144]|nr:HAD hydrolase-like protein [Verrucomicrobiales bacterium]